MDRRQILQYNHDSLIAEYICSKVDCLDTQNLSLSDLPDLLEADELELTEPTDTQHFSLGSRQATKSFTDIEVDNIGNSAFNQFHIKLNEFLNRAFAANNIPYPDGRRVRLTVDDMVC